MYVLSFLLLASTFPLLTLSFNASLGWNRHFPLPLSPSIVETLPVYGPVRLFTPGSHPGSRAFPSIWSAPFRVILGFGVTSLVLHPDLDIDPGVVARDDSLPDAFLSDLWEYNFDHDLWRHLAGPKGPGVTNSFLDPSAPASVYSPLHVPYARTSSASWIGDGFSQDGLGGSLHLFGGLSVKNASRLLRFVEARHPDSGPTQYVTTAYCLSPSSHAHNALWEFDLGTYSWREIFPDNHFVELEDRICHTCSYIDYFVGGLKHKPVASYFSHFTRGEFYANLQPPPLHRACSASSRQFPHRQFIYAGTIRTALPADVPTRENYPLPPGHVDSFSNMLFQFDSHQRQFRLLHNGTCPNPLNPDPVVDIAQCEFEMPTRDSDMYWYGLTHPMTNISVGVYDDHVAPRASFNLDPTCWAHQDLFVTFSGDLSSRLWGFNSTRLQWARLSEPGLGNTDQNVVAFDQFHPNNTVTGRIGASAWTFYEESDVGYEFPLFGLFSGITFVSETLSSFDEYFWIFSPIINQWKALDLTLADPSLIDDQAETPIHARYGPVAAVTHSTNQLILVGGLSEGSIGIVDLWTFDSFRTFCGEHAVFDNSTGIPFCNCSVGYSGPTCDVWSCNNVNARDSHNVCNGRGICLLPDHCQCFPDAEGEWCAQYQCHDVDSEDPTVCSGQGDCVHLHECVCDTENDAYGVWCEEVIGPSGLVHSSKDSPSDWISLRYVLANLDVHDLFVDSCTQIIYNLDDLGLSPHCLLDGSQLYVYLTSKWDWNHSSELFILPLTSKKDDSDEDRKVRVSLQPFFSPDFSSPFTPPIIVGIVFGVIVLLVLVAVGIAVAVAICYSAQRLQKQDEIVKYFELESQTLHGRRTTAGRLTVRQLADSTMEIDYSELDVKEVIGRGGSNSVIFKSIYAGQTVAFKCFRMSDLAGDEDFMEFEKEVTILASIRHPNVLRFYGVSLAKNRIGLVMEFCSNGDIKSYYSTNEVSFEDKLRMMTEIASALSYLHEREIIHRDLKSENVLLDDSLASKLIDFGVSRAFEKDSQAAMMTQRVGTSVYMAPEIVQTSFYTSAVDIYSFAIMIFEMLTDNFQPYGEENSTFNIEYRVALDPQFRPEISAVTEILPSERRWIIPLIQMMWSHDPEIRPTSQELFSALQKRTATGVAVDVTPATIHRRRERLRSRRARAGGIAETLGSSESLENLANLVRLADEAQEGQPSNTEEPEDVVVEEEAMEEEQVAVEAVQQDLESEDYDNQTQASDAEQQYYAAYVATYHAQQGLAEHVE